MLANDGQNPSHPTHVNRPGNVQKFPPVTTATIALCIFIYTGLAIQNDYNSLDTLARFGYLTAPFVYKGGYWSLITSAFVHFNFLHFAFNAFWLWTFGRYCELLMGSVRYGLFVVAAAFVSSAMQFAVSGGISIGASGVGYALFGFLWVTRKYSPSIKQVLTNKIVSNFITWLFLCIGLSAFDILNIANTAHFSGLAFGMLLGAVGIRYQTNIARAGAAVALAISAISLVWNPWSVEWLLHRAYQAHEAEAYKLALTYYNRVLEKDGNYAWAFRNRAYVHDSLGYSELARADWEQAVQLDPTLRSEWEEWLEWLEWLNNQQSDSASTSSELN
ncbi:MAG: rhomboid family intramembrane serine protease [Cyanobacteria bacterium J06597_1]